MTAASTVRQRCRGAQGRLPASALHCTPPRLRRPAVGAPFPFPACFLPFCHPTAAASPSTEPHAPRGPEALHDHIIAHASRTHMVVTSPWELHVMPSQVQKFVVGFQDVRMLEVGSSAPASSRSALCSSDFVGVPVSTVWAAGQ